MTAARISDTNRRSPRVVGMVRMPTRSASGCAAASQVMTTSVDASSAKKIAVGNVQAIHAMLSMAYLHPRDELVSPLSPFLRGEGWGEGLSSRRRIRGDSPFPRTRGEVKEMLRQR